MEKMKRHTADDAHGGFYTAFIGSFLQEREIQEQFFGILLIFACHGPAATCPRSRPPPQKISDDNSNTTGK